MIQATLMEPDVVTKRFRMEIMLITWYQDICIVRAAITAMITER